MMKTCILLLLFCFPLLAEDGLIGPFIQDPEIIGKYAPEKSYMKPKNAISVVRGVDVPFCLWYNPDTWQVTKRSDALVDEIHFQMKEHPLWGTVIAETAPIPKEQAKALVWGEAEEHFQEVKFDLEEKRVINGLEVFCYQWSGVYGGQKDALKRGETYEFYGYVFTNKSSSLHIFTYCPKKDLRKYEGLMTHFLNGLTWCPDQ